MIKLITCLVFSLLVSSKVVAQHAPSTPMPTLAPVLERVLPGLVSVAVEGQSIEQNPFSDEFLRRFFGLQSDKSQQFDFEGVGSGVIIDSKAGYIVTNSHLVQNATLITVVLSDGRRFDGKKVGADSVTDLAVLQIDAENLVAAPLGKSDEVRTGDYVIAVGNPYGLSQTATMGIVSALGRSGLGIRGSEDFIQTDASINPGSSGGALLNMSGEVIGINSAILAPSGTNIGIGFAVPINIAREIADELIAHGEIRRGELGVGLQDLTPQLAEALETDALSGAVVTQVMPGSPADSGGLQVGDVITAIENTPISTAVGVTNRVSKERERAGIGIAVKRKKSLHWLRIVLASIDSAKVDVSESVPLLWTLVVTPSEARGAIVVELDSNSPAGRAGLEVGDLILGVNLNEITSPADIEILARQHRNMVLLQIERNGTIFLIPVM